MDEIKEKVWWLEHQIRALVVGRGMRPGRALRRLFKEATDDEVACLASLWDVEQACFGVSIGADKDLFAAGYNGYGEGDEELIHSCMSGSGYMVAESYIRHGVGIAVACIHGRPVARSLVWEGTAGAAYVKTYGIKAAALAVFLRKIAGLRQESLRAAPFADAIGIWKMGLEPIGHISIPEVRRGEASWGKETFLGDSPRAARYPVYEVLHQAREYWAWKKARVAVFCPYLD